MGDSAALPTPHEDMTDEALEAWERSLATPTNYPVRHSPTNPREEGLPLPLVTFTR
ncbi:MAG: hypothetical protein JWM10_163 [Myxococcaceae bacterium]|nr:hypothetical protein [Myxococcaceae bacterium]